MTRQLQPCGTIAAYNRHVKRRDPACQPCRAARAEYSRQWRRAKAMAETFKDARAVRDVLDAIDRTLRALGPLALAAPVDRLRDRFADRIKELNVHEARPERTKS